METKPGTPATWTEEQQMGHDNPRCTVASLRALGIEPTQLPTTDADVTNEFNKAGRNRRGLALSAIASSHLRPTVAQFIRAYPTGSYYLVTDEHAMALVDGELTDTEQGSNRRRVEFAFEVL